MVKLSEADLAVMREVVDICKATEGNDEAVQYAEEILDRIEQELLERGLVDIQLVAD